MSIVVEVQKATIMNSLPSVADFEKWIHTALISQRAVGEITLRIVDEQESKSLNYIYRHQDKPTNVLAFPYRSHGYLGDLVICAPLVAKEALAQDKSLEAHWAHLVIHGSLHLIGFDHISPEEAVTMESIEIQALKQLGFPNPYAEEN